MAKIKLWIRMRRKGDLRLLMWHDYGGRWVDPSTSQIADLLIFSAQPRLRFRENGQKKEKISSECQFSGGKKCLVDVTHQRRNQTGRSKFAINSMKARIHATLYPWFRW